MKHLLTPFANWRAHVLAALGSTATVLILSAAADNAGMLPFIAAKAAGIAIAYAAFRLARRWRRQGKIDDLMRLANDDD